jgi:hypothetical protein
MLSGMAHPRSAQRRLIALAAAMAFAAVASPAQAALTASDNDLNTTLPQTFTDGTGLALEPCSNAGCAIPGPRPNLGAPLAVPGNFDPSREAFWYYADAQLPSGSAEFAVEAAFLGALAPSQGSAFTRQRFRFDNLVGTYRLTTPFGSKVYPNLNGGKRAINDTVDTGCLAPPCNYQTADYGAELTTFLRPVSWTPGAPGTVSNTTGPVTGAPTGYNGVKLEKQVPVTLDDPTGWQVVEEQTSFTVQTQIASAPSSAVAFASTSATSVDFPGRRSDEASGTKRVTIKNDGAAVLDIGSRTCPDPRRRASPRPDARLPSTPAPPAT